MGDVIWGTPPWAWGTILGDVIQYGGHVQTKAVADGGRRTRIEFEMGGTT